LDIAALVSGQLPIGQWTTANQGCGVGNLGKVRGGHFTSDSATLLPTRTTAYNATKTTASWRI